MKLWTPQFKPLARFIPFMTVGLLATAVHYGVAVLSHYGAAILLPFWVDQLSVVASNWLGFMAAFPISYLGHRYWTFHQTQVTHKQAVSKLLGIALLSFLANQGLVWWGLSHTALPFWLLLGIVLLMMPVLTYLLSQYWVFKTHLTGDKHMT